MDDARTELLSRYLDGDLKPSEARAVEERLKNDSELAAELHDLEGVRSSLASLARQDQPPAKLDAMMEPLCRSAPFRPGVRPAVRWLGIAAALVLGFSVVLEVRRQSPSPANDPRTRRVAQELPTEPGDRFSLAPLPTSSIPEEDRPLGAVERLLASPLPGPILEEPPALEVLGPLEAGEVGFFVEPVTDTTAELSSHPRDRRESLDKNRIETDATPLPGSVSGTVPGPQAEDELTAGSLSPGTGNRGANAPWEEEASPGISRLYVFVNGETAWKEFRPATGCPIGRYSVRVLISEGAVASAWSLGVNPSTPTARRFCAGEAVRGIELEKVPDGEYLAELVVEKR